jgi:hypothetical protein
MKPSFKRCPTCGAVIRSLADRFWRKVEVCGPDECWPWKAALGANDYGKFNDHGRSVRSNRVAWTLTHGTIPHGLHVLHKCDNRACCNPKHLFLGTQLENIADRHRKGRDAHVSRPGMSNHQARLTDDAVRLIRATRGPLRLIAKEHGVSRSLVSLIRSGKRWGHVA